MGMSMKTDSSRREWLCRAGVLALSGAVGRAADVAGKAGCPMGFGTYGLPGYSLGEAVKAVAKAGFTSIEIVSIPGYHGDPDQVSRAQRKEIRRRIVDAGLRLGALMGMPTPDAVKRVENADRIRMLLELANDLAAEERPLIQSVLGGGRWEEKRDLFRDVLGEWVDLSSKAGVKLAIKPHRGHAMTRPAEAVWLIGQLQAEGRLGLVFDYSHYAFRGLPLDGMVDEALRHTSYLVMKDAVEEGGTVRFALPGEAGDFPHARVLRRLYQGGYRGEVCCEVSSQVWRAKGYDPARAVATCHANLTRIFKEAGVGVR